MGGGGAIQLISKQAADQDYKNAECSFFDSSPFLCPPYLTGKYKETGSLCHSPHRIYIHITTAHESDKWNN